MISTIGIVIVSMSIGTIIGFFVSAIFNTSDN